MYATLLQFKVASQVINLASLANLMPLVRMLAAAMPLHHAAHDMQDLEMMPSDGEEDPALQEEEDEKQANLEPRVTRGRVCCQLKIN